MASFLRDLIRQKLRWGRHWELTVHRQDRLTDSVTALRGVLFWWLFCSESSHLEGSYNRISIFLPEITITLLLLSCIWSRSKLFYISEFSEIVIQSHTMFNVTVSDLSSLRIFLQGMGEVGIPHQLLLYIFQHILDNAPCVLSVTAKCQPFQISG